MSVPDFIDGPGGIVAFGYPEFGRPYGEFFVPSIGEIVLDFDDHDDSNLGVAIVSAVNVATKHFVRLKRLVLTNFMVPFGSII